MAVTRKKGTRSTKKATGNRRRSRETLQQTLRSVNQRAHDRANRRFPQAGHRKSIRAAIDATAPTNPKSTIFHDDDDHTGFWLRRLARWIAGAALLPVAWITFWTFLVRFSNAHTHQNFWMTTEFWYFTIGCILLSTWLLSGYFRNFFLYLYVLGHELTHAVFVVLHRGRVTHFHVSTAGGYITTTKTNWMIALSPYFVPIYTGLVVLTHLALRHFGGLAAMWDPLFYGLIGATWSFHMIWTVWMIPKDQPDLKENGRFLSLVLIFLGNLIVLIVLMAAADPRPLRWMLEFSREWATFAAGFGDASWRMINLLIDAAIQRLGGQ